MIERLRPRAPLSALLVMGMALTLLYVPLLFLLCKVIFIPSIWQEVFGDEILMAAVGNSLVVAITTSILATLLGTLAVLGLHRSRSRGGKLLEALSLVSLSFPEIVFALSLLAWFFVLRLELGLTTVIIAHVSFSISYAMMIVGARIATLDETLEEAARDLGASPRRVLWTIVLPRLRPALVGALVLTFLLSFDDFLITYFVNGVGQDTLPVKLYTALKMGMSPKLTALSSLMLIFTTGILIILFRSPSFRQMSGRVTKIQWKQSE